MGLTQSARRSTPTPTQADLPLSIFLPPIFLWNKSSPLCMFCFTLTPKLFPAVTLSHLFYFPFLLSHLFPCPGALLCSLDASLHPPSSSSSSSFVFELLHLALSTSLPLSLSSPSASQILFIYGKIAADAALSLSSEVYVPLRRLWCPFWAVFHPCARGQACGTEELLCLNCWREHHNLCEYSTARCMSHVVFHESWVMFHHDQHGFFHKFGEVTAPVTREEETLYCE